MTLRYLPKKGRILAYLLPSPQSTSYAATKDQKVQLRSQELLASPIPTHRRKALSQEQQACNRILITFISARPWLRVSKPGEATEIRGYCLYQGPAHKAEVWLPEMQATVTTPRSGAVAEVFSPEKEATQTEELTSFKLIHGKFKPKGTLKNNKDFNARQLRGRR